MRKLVFSSLIIACSFSLFTQNPFLDKTEIFGDASFTSGLVMGIADMNGDGLDDLVRLDRGSQLHFDYQLSNQTGFHQQYIGKPHNFSLWSITLGDIDNNGYTDVILGGNATGIVVWMMGAESTPIDQITLPDADFYVQGTNLVDINQDGWLDLFVCNDDGSNRIYENDGTGQLNPNTSWIDFSQEDENLASGNYGSVWTDINNDGLIDLYVSKCKGGVTDPTDPRRVNQLFINNGDGTFTEKGTECFMDLGSQSWVSDFGDIDNDGDMDAFVANHDRPSQLMINDGHGFFSDYTDSMGVEIQGLIIQSHLKDFDNDGMLDIIVSGISPYLYINKGNYRFESANSLNANNTVTSYTLGDLNQDGFIDLYGSFAKDFVQPNIFTDQYWEAQPNTNHYLDISVQGVADNYDGIGARLTLYGPWGIQVRDIKTGEGYGITNSLVAHFGLGEHEIVDSLRIDWPNGTKDIISGLFVDQKYKVVQGGCVVQPTALSISGDAVLCEDDSTKLTWNFDGAVTWSEGTEDSVLIVKSSGVFFAQSIDQQGCPQNSTNLSIIYDPVEDAKIALDGDSVQCAGNTINLSVEGFDEVEWNTGALANRIEVDSVGSYFGIAQGRCREWISDTVSIRFLEVEAPIVNWEDTISGPELVSFMAMGDSLRWYLQPSDNFAFYTGQNFEIEVKDSLTLYIEQVKLFEGLSASVGEISPNGDVSYNNDNFNAQMIFDVYEDLTLVSVDVYTDDPGERTITLKSGNLPTQEVTVGLDSGMTEVELNFNLVPGINYRLSTDQEKNLSEFGVKSPRLYRMSSDDPLPYPYGSRGFVEIKQNNFSNDNFYYFFNWNVKKNDIYCHSERIPLQVVIDETTSVLNSENYPFKVFPNPFQQSFNVQFNETSGIEVLELWSIEGKKVKEITTDLNSSMTIDLQGMSSGVYVLKVHANTGVYSCKVLKSF